MIEAERQRGQRRVIEHAFNKKMHDAYEDGFLRDMRKDADMWGTYIASDRWIAKRVGVETRHAMSSALWDYVLPDAVIERIKILLNISDLQKFVEVLNTWFPPRDGGDNG